MIGAALVAATLLDRAERSVDLDPVRATVIGLADDLAYGLGVWEGMKAERSLAAIRPHVTWR